VKALCDGSCAAEFFGLDERIMMRALRLLEKAHKAQLFSSLTGSYGVKFFG
jgi:hypothetical protein